MRSRTSLKGANEKLGLEIPIVEISPPSKVGRANVRNHALIDIENYYATYYQRAQAICASLQSVSVRVEEGLTNPKLRDEPTSFEPFLVKREQQGKTVAPRLHLYEFLASLQGALAIYLKSLLLSNPA
jgi:hypothetical protein